MVSRPVLAGIMTIIVFVSGFSVGALWDNLRTNKIKDNLEELSVYSTALLLESQLVKTTNCDGFLSVLKGAIKDLNDALDEYDAYKDASLFELDRKKTLYKQYLLSNIRYWRLAEEYKEKCGWNTSIIIYFFDKSCGDTCQGMSTKLDYLKRKYGESILIFPINLDLAEDDPVANTLVRIYDIKTYPTIVVDGNKFGNIERSELEGLVCKKIRCN